MPQVDIHAELVVASAEVLTEGMSNADDSHCAQRVSPRIGRSRDFQLAVICFNRVVRGLLGDVTGGGQ